MNLLIFSAGIQPDEFTVEFRVSVDHKFLQQILQSKTFFIKVVQVSSLIFAVQSILCFPDPLCDVIQFRINGIVGRFQSHISSLRRKSNTFLIGFLSTQLHQITTGNILRRSLFIGSFQIFQMYTASGYINLLNQQIQSLILIIHIQIDIAALRCITAARFQLQCISNDIQQI